MDTSHSASSRSPCCTTNLLPDEPVDSDAFGGHERVAAAIATLVTQERGGKAIALTGGWGSGKSTVVRILRRLLGDRDSPNRASHQVFVFDAWAHQGDPLRRSFLERLIKFLLALGWLPGKSQKNHDPTDWEDRLEQLARRKEHVDVKSKPVLTPTGSAVAVCMLLMPVGLTLLAAGINRGYSGLWVPGTLLALSPLLAALVIALWQKKRHGNRRSFNILSVLINKTQETTRSTTVRTPDPTSVEFRDLFTEALGEALGEEQRRLVVVVDNLDRIDPEDALSIWATMRTFFDPEDQPSREWFDRLWLLVPYDPSGLERVWRTPQDLTGQPAEEDRGTPPSPRPPIGDRGRQLRKAFLDKTFQLTFHVPRPVLSDWRGFMHAQLRQAFPDHPDERDFHLLYRLYTIAGPAQGQSPTPRDIKLFINQVGALRRQWAYEVPLPVQALYVLHRDQSTQPQRQLLDPAFLLDPGISNLLAEPNLLRYMAALHFNVPPDKAMQVLISQEVIRALSAGASDQLAKLQALAPEGFAEVCEYVIQAESDPWARNEPRTLAMAALTLDACEVDDPACCQEMWRSMRRAAGQVAQWTGLDEFAGKGISAILRRCPPAEQPDLVPLLLKGLTATIPEPAISDPAELSTLSANWAAGALQVVRTVKQLGHEALIDPNFGVPGPPSFQLDVVTALTATNVSLDEARHFLSGQDALPAALEERCQSGELRPEHASAIELMADIRADWRWQTLITALDARLRANLALPVHEIAQCAAALFALGYRAGVSEATDKLRQLVQAGVMPHCLYQAHTSHDPDAPQARDLCLLATLCEAPDGQLPSHSGQSQQGTQYYSEVLAHPDKYEDLVKSVSQLAARFRRLPFLLGETLAPQTHAFVSRVLDLIASGPDAVQHLSPSVVIDHYAVLRQRLSKQRLEAHVATLVQKAALLPEFATRGFSVELADLYLLVLRVPSAGEDHAYREFLITGLRSVDQATWADQLSHEGPLSDLAMTLVELNCKPDLGPALQDALRDHAQSLLNDQSLPSELHDRWVHLLDALKKTSRKTFLRDLRDLLLRSPRSFLRPILQLYGQALLESGVLSEQSDDIVRNLFPQIVTRAEPSELDWLNTAVAESPGILPKAEDASRQVLADRVRTRLTEEDIQPEAMQRLEQVARTMGLDPGQIRAETLSAKESSEPADEAPPPAEEPP